MSRIVFGSFDAEVCWEVDRPSRLSPMHGLAADPGVWAMDELLAPLCGPDDTLCTLLRPDESLAAYHDAVGLGCRRRACGRPGVPERVCRALLERPNRGWMGEAVEARSEFRPYAVTADTEALWDHYRIEQPLPAVEAVRHVNSKVWSNELRDSLGLSGGGVVARDAREFEREGEALLARGGLMAKEEYGVSGRGNLHIASARRLRLIAASLADQEARGSRTRLVLEPYHDKDFDFSFQLRIGPEGEATLLSLQGARNRNSGYEGSFPLPDDQRRRVERGVPADFIQAVAEAIGRAGYFGPACIDAMALGTGEIVPLLEINARVTMGYLNHRLSERLGRGTFLGLLRLGAGDRGPIPCDALLAHLRRDGLLYDRGEGRGIVPLAAGTLPGAAAGGEGRGAAGRLYFAIPFADHGEIGPREAELRWSLSKIFKILN